MKSKLFKVIFAVLVVSVISACSNDNSNNTNDTEKQNEEIDFPTESLTGVIPFSPGGTTDSISRTIASIAEKELDESIVIQNSPGGTGSIATQEVYSEESDGHTLLFAAENQNLYRATDISELSFNDFEPIILLGREIPVFVTHADAKWETISEVLDEIDEDPKSISMMTTGPVGISGVVTSMLDKDFNLVPYDGAGEGIAGVIGKQVDLGVVGLASAIDYVEAGDLKILSVVNDEPLEGYEDLPVLGEERPEYQEFLPWGPYYGVYVNKDTPDATIDALVESFQTSWDKEEFQSFLSDNNIVPMGYSGEEALEFQQDWESKTNWLLYEAGEASNPSEFDIKQP